MHKGNWKCSGCGGAITELPFQPRSETGLTCRDCYMKSKGGSNTAPAEAPMSPPAGPMDMDVPDDAQPATEAPPFEGMDHATPVAATDKPKFEGNWTCSGCGGTISSLPFQPRDTSNLKCLDCFKRSKQ